MRNIKNIKTVIIKVGSSSLCNQQGQIEEIKINHLVDQISKLRDMNYTVVLVSSGAIAAGMGVLKLAVKPETMPEKQALAAIGQAKLMQIYEAVFHQYHMECAQVLLNHGDFDERSRLLNLSNTMRSLIQYGVVPIINENDALAVDEIKVGDNDTLAALLVPVIEADLLVLVSDIDGLFTANPCTNPDAKLLKYVDHVDEHIEQMAGTSSSNLGTGGMMTKIKAAKIVNDYGSHMVIVNGNKEMQILHIFDEQEAGTWFNGVGGVNLNARAHWLTYRAGSKGNIIIDKGAEDALTKSRKSLLPSGILSVKGSFMMGQVVSVENELGVMIAKGVVNYSSEEIQLIKGKKTDEIIKVLNHKDYDEVIHANNMVMIGGRVSWMRY